MVAPVLPAETMAMALPSRTASAARTSDESFLRRTPWAGSSSMPMTSLAGKHGEAAGVAHLPGPADQGHRDPGLLGRLAGAGHDLAGGPVAAHGIDRDRKARERVTGRPCAASGH